jgi:adenylate kinase family enzyme
MQRVVILGPGGAGKTTLARQLAATTGLPAIELDQIFWGHDLAATPREQWVAHQRVLVAQDRWILDGDLGPYDALEIRLQAADTVIFLDVSPLRCAWRALRRAPERLDFWLWLLQYRRRSRPLILRAMATYAGHAAHHILRNPVATRRFLATVERARLARRGGAPVP